MVDFTRKITHQGYKNSEKLKKYYHRVEKKIHVKPSKLDNGYVERKRSDYILYDDKFLVVKVAYFIVPVIFGVASLILSLLLIFPLSETRDTADWALLIISICCTIFFVIFGLTMPKKESILNRKDGLITFAGFLWQPNITMEFKKTEFAYSTGGEDLVGGFQLQIIRPNKWQTFAITGYVGSECYEDMSFITWYMDKNRPLPPGEAFDPYRQQDFERRKAEGFPKPLYPSKISTPETTKEQQAERKRIGGW
ncbi:hypothetical protein VBY74_13400 [Tenacibaculum ascidiaceicola]|uniref:hypothetical protein n=1 Tax=Tenacibaculum ascidiaceicola TaxID=1699411 RepID=UPI0039ECB022